MGEEKKEIKEGEVVYFCIGNDLCFAAHSKKGKETPKAGKKSKSS